MAKRIAEVEVVARLDRSRYNAELKALTASTIAEMEALEREQVKIDIDINRNEVRREISKLQDELTRAQAAGSKASKERAKQVEQLLKKERNELQKLNQAANEYNLALRILKLNEKESAAAIKDTITEIDKKSNSLRATFKAHQDHSKIVESDSRAMRIYQRTVADTQAVVKTMGDEQAKFNKVWAVLTNSKTPVDTLKRLGREGVRIGPFNATIKGLISAFIFLGPLVQSVGLSLMSLVGVAGGAATAFGALGLAVVGGFGQAFVGLKYAMKPVADEFKVLTQTGEAYNKAVMKYGEGSKQAKKAQEQMNNALKSASPLSREAATSFQQAKLQFAQMTGPARDSMRLLLADSMKTVKQLSPQFANNTNRFSAGLQQGTSGFLSQVRQDSTKRGGGAFGTMFSNAAAATRPLVTAIGNITMALANVGASASRHLGPLVATFQNWSAGVLRASGDTGSMNSRIDSLMQDLKSVGRLFMAAGRWAREFFGASREAGRSLTDGLTGKFDKWTDSLKNDGGRKRLSEWFMDARDLVSNLANTFGPLISAVSMWAEALTPATATAAGFTSAIAQVFGWLAKLPIVSQVFQSFLVGAGAMQALGIAATVLAGTFGRLFGMMAMGGAAVMRFVNTSTLVMTALMGINSVAPRVATALLAIGTSSTLALGAFGLLVVGVAGLVYGLQQLTSFNSMDDLKSKAEQARQALENARLKAKELLDTLQGNVDAEFYGKANVMSAKEELNAAKQSGDKERIAMATERLAMAERDYAQAINERIATEKESLKNADTQIEKAGDSLSAKQDMLDRKGVNFDAITASTQQYDNVLSGLVDKINQAEDQINAGPGMDPENFDAAGLEASIKKWKEQYDLIVAARKARQEYSKTTIMQAATPVINARVKAKFDAKPADLQQSLGRLAMAGGQPLAIKVATKVKDSGDATRTANAAVAALQRGVSSKQITALVGGRVKDPGKLVKQIEGLKAIMPVKIDPAATQQANSLHANLQRTANKDVIIHERKAKASGGIVSAAGGYSINSAIGRASSRPTRNVASGARINEPTLAIGEENRTEYVIATNPAYRAQNVSYLRAAASDLGMMVVEPAAGGRTPWRQRKVLLNAIFNPSLNDDKRKVFSKDVRTSAANIKGIEDEASALQKMMDNDEMRNRPNAWRSHRNQRGKMLQKLLGVYRMAYPAAGRNNRRALRGMIAGVEGEILQLRADKFDGAISKSAEEMKQAELDRTTRENATLRASLLTAQAFNTVSGGLLAESFSGGPLASGGPRMSSKSGGVNVVINTLHPGSPDVYDAIGKAATAGQSLQGAVQAPRIAVPV